MPPLPARAPSLKVPSVSPLRSTSGHSFAWPGAVSTRVRSTSTPHCVHATTTGVATGSGVLHCGQRKFIGTRAPHPIPLPYGGEGARSRARSFLLREEIDAQLGDLPIERGARDAERLGRV